MRRTTVGLLVLALAVAGAAVVQPETLAKVSPLPAARPARLRKRPARAPSRRRPPPAADRERNLGPGWQNSRDIAWTTRGDADGLHLLVAEERAGYEWRTGATLSKPGVAVDRWIGNVCVTASGRRAVVVYGRGPSSTTARSCSAAASPPPSTWPPVR